MIGNMKKWIITVFKVLVQLILIWVILQVGDNISRIITPFIKVPGSIIGMLLLLGLLLTGLVKVRYLKETSDFLLKHMGFFFVPLGVSLMNAFDFLKESWFSMLALLLISCVLVMFASSKVTDLLISLKLRRDDVG